MRVTRSPRRPRPAAAAALVCVLVGLSACSSSGGDTPSASNSGASGGATSGGGAATPATSTSAPGIAGAPAELTALVDRIYGGGDLGGAASPSAAAALAKRTPRTGAVSGTASLGTWSGSQIAVITAGADVTLAVGPQWRVVGGWWPSLGVPTPSLGSGPQFVLALGSDARKGQDMSRTRADVLQVIGLDGKGGAGVMGMARDLWVPLSTGGKGKINSAMVFGGPAAQLKTVRAVTGLPIQGWALIDFTGFTTLIDDQGGIPIVVPETVNAAHAHLVIKAGPQTLSGKEALAYARERKTLPDGDFGRSRHQGQLILAAAVKAKLAGPSAIPTALTSFDKVGRSNLSAEQILTFAAGLYRVNPTQVGRGVAAGEFGWAAGQSIVILGNQAKRLFADFRDGRLG